MDHFFQWAVSHKSRIVGLWKILYVLLFSFLLIGALSIVRQDANAGNFFVLGRQAGQLGLVLFIVIAIPGIARRFGFRHPAIVLLKVFRRYFGITMYILALMHAGLVRFALVAAGLVAMTPVPTFILFGTLALSLLFLLFFTSNDLSVRKLGVWWQRIHNLFYIVMWLIFLHVGFQRLSIWTILIGGTSLIEFASFIWEKKYRV
ncbi:ferric reductase-like transmembrane domain-containing protein [Candidatus Gottesmanbacteria bacterium]|nr:ferric reductase-like transmembrane domain-containing protein [Candidatus Gottesmanbacteria bacterium]